MDFCPSTSRERVKFVLRLHATALLFLYAYRFYFATPEIMFAAEQQLEAADGIEDTPFVTVKVTLDENSQAVVEAFQVLSYPCRCLCRLAVIR